MKNLDKILKYLDTQNIKVSKFEREAGLGNSYFNNVKKRGEDITAKMLDRIRINTPDIYYAIYPEEKKTKDLNNPSDYTKNNLQSRVHDEEANPYSAMQALIHLAESNRAEAEALLLNAKNAQKIIAMIEDERKNTNGNQTKASA